MSANTYFNTLHTPVKEIAKELRQIVKGLSVELKEEIKWNVPTYSINKNICSIMAHKKHVNLQIMKGSSLHLPGQLEGTGKDMRHLTLCSLTNIDQSLIENLLVQAIELD